jgi:phosphoglycerate dehydrogenase-like enzyme
VTFSFDTASATAAAIGRSDRPRVVVLGEQPISALTAVEERAEVVYTGSEDLAAALTGADVLFVRDFSSAALRDAWHTADRLRWVHAGSAGVERLLFRALIDSDVVVTNSKGVFDRAMAEYVLGLVLAFAKGLPDTLALQGDRVWEHRETETIEGKTVLVVGAGSIGRAIGRLLGAVGMRVSGVGRAARTDPDLGVVHPAHQLMSVLPDADYVVVAAPLTEHTREMLGERAFAVMKPTARLINVGRGPVVDEHALLGALREGRLTAAALDVFAHEPLPPEHPLWRTPNVLVSPHMSGDVAGWQDAVAGLFVDNFYRWCSGEPLVNVVDKQLGFVTG